MQRLGHGWPRERVEDFPADVTLRAGVTEETWEQARGSRRGKYGCGRDFATRMTLTGRGVEEG